jgi:hypothetical protein
MFRRLRFHISISRFGRNFALAAVLATSMSMASPSPANPIGDFFKSVGRTLGKWHQTPPPEHAKKKSRKNKSTGENQSGNETEEHTTSAPPTPAPTPTPTPTPIDIRPATLAPRSQGRRDVPYAVAVPNKPGLVTSPYAPRQGYVDVHAFPSSTEVLDPFTGKIFLTP